MTSLGVKKGGDKGTDYETPELFVFPSFVEPEDHSIGQTSSFNKNQFLRKNTTKTKTTTGASGSNYSEKSERVRSPKKEQSNERMFHDDGNPIKQRKKSRSIFAQNIEEISNKKRMSIEIDAPKEQWLDEKSSRVFKNPDLSYLIETPQGNTSGLEEHDFSLNNGSMKRLKVVIPKPRDNAVGKYQTILILAEIISIIFT